MSTFLNIGGYVTLHEGVRKTILRTGLCLESKKTREIRMYVRDARKHSRDQVDADYFPCIMMYGPDPKDIEAPEPRGLIDPAVSLEEIVDMLRNGEWFVRILKAELL